MIGFLLCLPLNYGLDFFDFFFNSIIHEIDTLDSFPSSIRTSTQLFFSFMLCSVRFPGLIYMRCNYTFNYINVIAGEHYLIDSVTADMYDTPGSPKVHHHHMYKRLHEFSRFGACCVRDTPQQGHIALTENDDEMMVIYVTGTSTTPQVKYVRVCVIVG